MRNSLCQFPLSPSAGVQGSNEGEWDRSALCKKRGRAGRERDGSGKAFCRGVWSRCFGRGEQAGCAGGRLPGSGSGGPWYVGLARKQPVAWKPVWDTKGGRNSNKEAGRQQGTARVCGQRHDGGILPCLNSLHKQGNRNKCSRNPELVHSHKGTVLPGIEARESRRGCDLCRHKARTHGGQPWSRYQTLERQQKRLLPAGADSQLQALVDHPNLH